MRSLPSGLLEYIADPQNLWAAWQGVARGKRRGPTVARYALEIDRDLFALHRELLAGVYRPRPWRLRVEHDPKPRLIAAPAVRDRVVHRALLDRIGPHFTRRCIDTHFTCGPGRGAHHAALAFLSANRRLGWRLHLDIHRYFPSIAHAVLEHLLCRPIRDQRVCALIRTILDAGSGVYRSPEARRVLLPAMWPLPPRTGLPLGSYFSQWAGAYYLDGLDHYVKRELKIPVYLRYMDDFVLFHDERARLAQSKAAIADWLEQERGLRLNPRRGRVEPRHHPAVFVGYRISRSGLSPSRRLRRRLKQRLARAALSGPRALRRTLSAYRGLLWV